MDTNSSLLKPLRLLTVLYLILREGTTTTTTSAHSRQNGANWSQPVSPTSSLTTLLGFTALNSFLIPKKDKNEHRLTSDLRNLNKYTFHRHIKVPGLETPNTQPLLTSTIIWAYFAMCDIEKPRTSPITYATSFRCSTSH